jgi:hypothetical protein
MGNTQIQSVDRIQSFLVLLQAAHTVSIGLRVGVLMCGVHYEILCYGLTHNGRHNDFPAPAVTNTVAYCICN